MDIVTSEPSRVSKFLKDKQLFIAVPLTAVATAVLAHRFKVAGADDAIRTLWNNSTEDLRLIGTFIAEKGLTDEFNALLEKR